MRRWSPTVCMRRSPSRRRCRSPLRPKAPLANVAGQWEVEIQYMYGSARNTIVLEQDAAKLMGTHHGEFAAGDLAGTVAANTVKFQSSIPPTGPACPISSRASSRTGKCRGTVALGEYGEARWTAERHQYRTGTEQANMSATK